MGRHDVPEEDVLGQPQLGEHAVDDGRGSLARRRARELALGRERDAAHARAAVAGGLAHEEHPRVAACVEVAGESAASCLRAGAVAVEVAGGPDPGRREVTHEVLAPHRAA